MEQLIKINQDELNKKHRSELDQLDKDIQYKYKELEERHQYEIKKLNELHNEKRKTLEKTYYQNQDDITKSMYNIWNELKLRYEEYLQGHIKGMIFIKGKYYNDNPSDIQIEASKYVERTLDNWIKYNKHKMDVINLFLKELSISYDLSLSPYNMSYSRFGYSYSGGEDLIITFNKSD